MVRSYRDLRVWQYGMDLVVECYRATRTFPKDELYGLVSQMRRAAVSIPSNIAEGHGRLYTGQYLQHVSVANGSLMELETQILISARLGFLTAEETKTLLSRTADLGRMLAGLLRKLQQKRSS